MLIENKTYCVLETDILYEQRLDIMQRGTTKDDYLDYDEVMALTTIRPNCLKKTEKMKTLHLARPTNEGFMLPERFRDTTLSS